MTLFTDSAVRQRAHQTTMMHFSKNAGNVLFDSINRQSATDTYDIFLSHSFKDAEIVLGLKELFEDLGYRVYVDWIYDKHLNRSNITRETAEVLKKRMRQAKSLFYVTTENATNSKWMPWECGFFDGINSKVAIVPVVQHSQCNCYSGQEYLGLYPYITKGTCSIGHEHIWVRKNSDRYLNYSDWINRPEDRLNWEYS